MINIIIVIDSEYFATTSADLAIEMWISLHKYDQLVFNRQLSVWPQCNE
jgi:hypothetical protein